MSTAEQQQASHPCLFNRWEAHRQLLVHFRVVDVVAAHRAEHLPKGQVQGQLVAPFVAVRSLVLGGVGRLHAARQALQALHQRGRALLGVLHAAQRSVMKHKGIERREKAGQEASEGAAPCAGQHTCAHAPGFAAPASLPRAPCIVLIYCLRHECSQSALAPVSAACFLLWSIKTRQLSSPARATAQLRHVHAYEYINWAPRPSSCAS